MGLFKSVDSEIAGRYADKGSKDAFLSYQFKQSPRSNKINGKLTVFPSFTTNCAALNRPQPLKMPAETETSDSEGVTGRNRRYTVVYILLVPVIMAQTIRH